MSSVASENKKVEEAVSLDLHALTSNHVRASLAVPIRFDDGRTTVPTLELLGPRPNGTNFVDIGSLELEALAEGISVACPAVKRVLGTSPLMQVTSSSTSTQLRPSPTPTPSSSSSSTPPKSKDAAPVASQSSTPPPAPLASSTNNATQPTSPTPLSSSTPVTDSREIAVATLRDQTKGGQYCLGDDVPSLVRQLLRTPKNTLDLDGYVYRLWTGSDGNHRVTRWAHRGAKP